MIMMIMMIIIITYIYHKTSSALQTWLSFGVPSMRPRRRRGGAWCPGSTSASQHRRAPAPAGDSGGQLWSWDEITTMWGPQDS